MEIQDVLVLLLFVGVPLAQYLWRALREPEGPPAPAPTRQRQPPRLPNVPRPRPTAPKTPGPAPEQSKAPVTRPAAVVRVAAPPVTPAAARKPARQGGHYAMRMRSPVGAAGLSNTAELRRAMVLTTILGPCRAAEPYHGS